jgi:hypothetical protein
MALGRALEQQSPVIATREQSAQLAQVTRMLELRPVGLLVVHPLIVGEHVVGALLLGVGEADARPSASQIETARALAIAGSAEAMGVGWVGGPSPAWPGFVAERSDAL